MRDVASCASISGMENPLLKFRTDNGLYLEQAAKKCGVHASTYLRWERGEINVSMPNLERVSSVTGIPKGKLRCLTMRDNT